MKQRRLFSRPKPADLRDKLNIQQILILWSNPKQTLTKEGIKNLSFTLTLE